MYYFLEIPPKQTKTFSAYCAIAPSEQKAIEAYDAAPKQTDPIQSSVSNWQEFFNKAPKFSCSDPYLEKYYYYRWYGLRLNMVNTGGKFKLPYPCIFEGINAGWFRHHISYSAQVHMLDMRWLNEPDIAMGSLLNFIANQNEDGSFPGAIKTGDQEKNSGFYHANWGRAVREVYRIHPNQNFLIQVYESLSRYAEYFENERDKEKTNLYDVWNQWETGQEYMSRYLFVNKNADEGEAFQLKGIDATVYIYELQKNLGWLAAELGLADEAAKWELAAVKTYEAILTKMWDDSLKFFVDVNPQTLKKSPYKPAVGFYPFMTDLANETHAKALTEHLLNPNEFWTEYPLPSTSLAGPYANIFGEWKDKRLVCPWSGRSWLMTTSHVCEALAHFSQNVDISLKPQAVELIERYIRMLFLDKDINCPSSYEYYNPVTGKPPYFRGTDDYMHSWIIDLIIKYVVGLQPMDGNKIVMDPLPFDLESFTLDNVLVKGRLLKIMWRKKDTPAIDKGYYIFVDNKLVKKLKNLERYEFNLK